MKLSNALKLATSLFALRGNHPSSAVDPSGSSSVHAHSGNLGNVTLALEEYFVGFVVLDSPKCTAAFKRIGRTKEAKKCYPYMVEANMISFSKHGPEVLENYVDRYCTSGCNEYSYRLFQDVLGKCSIQPAIVKALLPADARRLILEHIRMQTALTCLRSSGDSQYCMAEIVQILEKAALDANSETLANVSDDMAVNLLCQSDCGSQVLQIAANMTTTKVRKLCTKVRGTLASSIGSMLGFSTPTAITQSGLETATPSSSSSDDPLSPTLIISEMPDFKATPTRIEQSPASPFNTAQSASVPEATPLSNKSWMKRHLQKRTL